MNLLDPKYIAYSYMDPLGGFRGLRFEGRSIQGFCEVGKGLELGGG